MATDSVNLVAKLGGELVTYTPAGSSAKTFKAVVDRRPTQPDQVGVAQFAVNSMEVWFPRDGTDGVTVVQERKDRIRFKKRLQDASDTDFQVIKVIEEDAGIVASDGGMFHVLVQA